MDKGFESFRITRQFTDALTAMGLTEPTEIQRMAIVPAMSGQDVLGIAETGSGKTLAYLIPLAMKVKYARSGYVQAIILGPAKELVIQIHQVLERLTANTDIRSVCLYGGIGPKEQAEQLKAGVDIIVCTPGRLLDLYSRGHIHMKELRTLVLDEADRMLEMGFMSQLRRILEVIPVKRQNLLFSATFPERVETLAAEFLEFPTRVQSAAQGKPVEALRQEWYATTNFRSKLVLLIHLLKTNDWPRVMVFCSTKDSATRAATYLDRQNVGSVRVIHANKGQNARINALDAFRTGEVRVLVTTDVTSRGIDVEAVSPVVNLELPSGHEDYLHRVGRTARMGREGLAITFANEAEKFNLIEIIASVDSTIAEMPWPSEVAIAPDLPGERQEILRELDRRRKAADPTFQGAFHEKKRKPVQHKPKKRPSAKKKR
jgi:ATP-dependent RNA helicase RhlE